MAKKEFQESFLVAQHVSHPPYHQQHHIKSLIEFSSDLLQIGRFGKRKKGEFLVFM